jgi:type IV secretion system protein VirB5
MRDRIIILIAILAIFASPARAQGIPVYDNMSLIQQVQQVMSWANQLQAMSDQFQQLESQYKSLTGNRGYGNILNNPLLQQYLPPELQDAAKQLQALANLASQGLNGIGGKGQALRNQLGDNRSCSMYADTQTRQSCNLALATPYQTYDNYQSGIGIASQRSAQIQGLIQQIQTTDDPKAIAELQARIAGESAAVQNEMLKAQLQVQLADVQNKLVKEQAERDRLNAMKKDGDNGTKRLLEQLRGN